MDEQEVTNKAFELMKRIFEKNHDLLMDSVKKLNKENMHVTKDMAARLISEFIGKAITLEASLLEIYNSLVYCENAVIKKIAAKHLPVCFSLYYRNS